MGTAKRTFVLPIVGAVSSAFLTWGCERNYQVCIDRSHTRVPDSYCDGWDPSYRWLYFGSGGGGVPRIGVFVSGGSDVRVAGASYSAAPSEGVVRGGFGGSGEGHGGGE